MQRRETRRRKSSDKVEPTTPSATPTVASIAEQTPAQVAEARSKALAAADQLANAMGTEVNNTFNEPAATPKLARGGSVANTVARLTLRLGRGAPAGMVVDDEVSMDLMSNQASSNNE